MYIRNRELLRQLMAGRYNTVTLASRTGLSKQVIAYLTTRGRSGRSSCNPRTARLIADALGVEVEVLFCDRLLPESNNRRRSS